MLLLNGPKRWVPWHAAGIELRLSPLTSQRKSELVAETTEVVYDDNGRVRDVERDVTEYARRVGQECIHDWRGIQDENGKRPPGVMMPPPDDPDGTPVEAPCDAAHIAAFMQIEPAQKFVFGQVEGLGLYLDEQVDDAKKD